MKVTLREATPSDPCVGFASLKNGEAFYWHPTAYRSQTSALKIKVQGDRYVLLATGQIEGVPWVNQTVTRVLAEVVVTGEV